MLSLPGKCFQIKGRAGAQPSRCPIAPPSFPILPTQKPGPTPGPRVAGKQGLGRLRGPLRRQEGLVGGLGRPEILSKCRGAGGSGGAGGSLGPVHSGRLFLTGPQIEGWRGCLEEGRPQKPQPHRLTLVISGGEGDSCGWECSRRARRPTGPSSLWSDLCPSR